MGHRHEMGLLMQRNTPGLSRLIRTRLAERGIRPNAQPSPVYAYANHGRWVADCPSCNGAEHVKEDELFLCGTCGRQSQVVWPEETGLIEELLEGRDRKHQNWNIGEPVDQLAFENERRG